MKYARDEIKPLTPEIFDLSNVDISREGFKKNLILASHEARDYARSMVINSLPDNINFVIYNGLTQKKYLEKGEVNIVDAVYDGKKIYTDIEQVLECLWRELYVPVWINVQVVGQTESSTIVSLRCGNRFSNDPVLIYHVKEGKAPFHVLSPNLPPGWSQGNSNEKFDLYWQKNT